MPITGKGRGRKTKDPKGTKKTIKCGPGKVWSRAEDMCVPGGSDVSS